LHEIPKCELLERYVQQLRKFMRGRPAISVQAVATRVSLGSETPTSIRWLKWIAEVSRLDFNDAEFICLVRKGSKTTAAAWVSKEPVRTALVLMMGTNNLPADEGLTTLATGLRKFWGRDGTSIETDSPLK
jgi:hypothetical protein